MSGGSAGNSIPSEIDTVHIMIPFIGFAPDLDPTTPGVITESFAVVPTWRGGYFGGSVAVDIGMDALADDALSAVSMITLSGSIRTFAGSATKLYEKSGVTWTDRSRATPAYAASASNIWRFAQFGKTTLAVNKADKLQSISTGTAFADLDAPTASLMCVWNGFVILADTNDGGSGQTFGDSPSRWWTSAYLNETSWTPSIATQCTTGELVDTPGRISGLKVLGEYVIAYKEKSIYVGRDAGSPTVLQFTKIPGDIGCASQEAIANIGDAHIFISKNDIFMFDGNTVKSIGGPLRIWFFKDLDVSYASRIRAMHDEYYGLVLFNYPRAGSGGALNGIIIYNYRSDKWGFSTTAIKTPFEYVAGGYRYDTLPIEGKTYADWPPISYDDPFWDANKSYIAFFATDNKVYAITGSGGPASITTGAYGAESFYTLLQRVTLRYLLKPPVATTMTHFYTTDLGGTWTQGETVTESNGRFDILHSAPWHKVRFNFTDQFEVIGMTADTQPDGEL